LSSAPGVALPAWVCATLVKCPRANTGLLARWRRRAALQPLGPGLAFGAALIVAGAGLMAR
ncbi:hypothetical protein WLX13_24790, partial [Bordetella bronchiseptica]